MAAERSGSQEPRGPMRPSRVYSLIVGLVFIALIAVATVNTLSTEGGGVLGSGDEGDLPLAQFAVADARGDLSGDANVAQDDCDVSEIPCPSEERRTPACEVELEGAIPVCKLFDRPLMLSFWFTRGGECEAQQDVFEAAYRRFRERVNFLAINARDERDEVRALISTHGWTHPIGLDPDGALTSLYRVGGCPTFLYVYPGGILQSTSIGELDQSEFFGRVTELIAAARRRAAESR